MCANYSLYILGDILIDIKKPANNLTGLSSGLFNHS